MSLEMQSDRDTPEPFLAELQSLLDKTLVAPETVGNSTLIAKFGTVVAQIGNALGLIFPSVQEIPSLYPSAQLLARFSIAHDNTLYWVITVGEFLVRLQEASQAERYRSRRKFPGLVLPAAGTLFMADRDRAIAAAKKMIEGSLPDWSAKAARIYSYVPHHVQTDWFTPLVLSLATTRRPIHLELHGVALREIASASRQLLSQILGIRVGPREL